MKHVNYTYRSCIIRVFVLFLFLELYKAVIITSVSLIRKLELRKLVILFKEY